MEGMASLYFFTVPFLQLFVAGKSFGAGGKVVEVGYRTPKVVAVPARAGTALHTHRENKPGQGEQFLPKRLNTRGR